MKKTLLSLAAGLLLTGLSTAPALADAGYLADDRGNPVKSSAGLCWRTAAWTPAHASADCDADLLPKPAAPAAPLVVAAVTPPPAAPRHTRHTFEADPLFDFASTTLRDSGMAKLDTLATQMMAMAAVEKITVIGHTDRLGATDYNLRLSEERAAAVRDHLASAGVPVKLIHIEGRGETEPATAAGICSGTKRTSALIACLQPDRRVEVEVDALAPSEIR